MIKKFLTFSEAAATLEVDYTGLKQAIETGLSLAAYVYCGDKPLRAVLAGPGVKSERDESTGMPLVRMGERATVYDGFFVEDVKNGVLDTDLGDELGDVCFEYAPEGQVCFELRGFFRISPSWLKSIAREERARHAAVSPQSWWAGGAPKKFEFAPDRPSFFFHLRFDKSEGYKGVPNLEDIYFRAEDVLQLAAASHKKAIAPESEASRTLSTRERSSFLSVIAAMHGLLLDRDGGGFPSQASLIEALGERYGSLPGLSKRNLEKLFAEASRSAGSSDRPA